MRKALTLTLIVAATAVTAMIASPAQPVDLQHLTLTDAAAMSQRTAVAVSLLFVWLVGSVVVALMSPREMRYASVEVRVAPIHCLLLGLVGITSFILTAVAFSYVAPTVGTPLLIALGVFAILTKIFGLIAVFHAVGTKIAGAHTFEQLARKRWLRGDLAMVVAGLLILGALRLIPVVGPIVWAGASVFGVGVALATKFGRREPWFLAWHVVGSGHGFH